MSEPQGMFSQRSEDVGTLTERTCLEGANSKLTLRSQGETFRKCLQMVMGWSGLGWGWKSPSGSLILASFLFFLDSPLFHVSASIDSGVVRSSISSPDYPNLFSRRCFYYYYYWFLLEYIRESLSFSQLLMLSEIFLFGSMNIRAGLLSTTSLRQQTRERNNLAAVCL